MDIWPIHRPKDWHRLERIEQKERKVRSWYKTGGFDSVLFVPETPNANLKRMYEHTIQGSGLRIKVVERSGRTLKSELQRSNPFRNGGVGEMTVLSAQQRARVIVEQRA